MSTLVVNKFGRNPDIDASREDVWDGGGDYVWSAAAQFYTLSSDNDNDAANDTGARELMIYGLDGQYRRVFDVLELNGLTPVMTSIEFLRIWRMKVVDGGITGVNIGKISAAGHTDGLVSAVINPGNNQTLMAVYTVPADYTLNLRQYYSSVGVRANSDSTTFLLVRPFGEVFQVKHAIAANSQGSSYAKHRFDPDFPVSAKSDIVISAETGVNNADVFAGFDGRLVCVGSGQGVSFSSVPELSLAEG